MNPKEFLSRCRAEGHRACKTGAEFARQYETMAEVWAACERADWLIWILVRLGGHDRELRLFACACAEIALYRIENPDPRSIEAVRVTRLFADGLATAKELGSARSMAWAAEASEEAAWLAAWVASSASAEWAATMAESASWSAEERKTQLETLKRMVSNPFKKDVTL